MLVHKFPNIATANFLYLPVIMNIRQIFLKSLWRFQYVLQKFNLHEISQIIGEDEGILHTSDTRSGLLLGEVDEDPLKLPSGT